MLKKKFLNLKEKSKPKAELRLSEDEEIEVLQVEDDLDVSEPESDEDDDGESVKLFESSVFLNNEKEDTGKSFRSKELSEDDLSERDLMPSLEDQWVRGDKNIGSTGWLKRSIVIGALVVGAAVIWAFTNIEKEPYSKEKREKELARLELLSQEEDAARAQDMRNIINCVKNYIESTTIEEQAKWSRNPKTTLDKMVSHYSDQLTFSIYHFEGIKTQNIFYVDDVEMVMVVVEVSSLSGDLLANDIEKSLLLERQPDGTYLVDWETAAIYQPTDWQSFVKNMDTNPGIFRLDVVNRNDYGPYLYNFSEDNKYQAYRVSIKDDDNFLIAYARKDSDIDLMIKSLFTDKKIIPLTLKLRFPENATTDQCVEITEIVSKSWFVK